MNGATMKISQATKCEHTWAEIKAVRSACNVAVDIYVLLLQLVNAIVPDTQAAGQNLQQFARTAIDRVQETANEFKTSLQAATHSQPAH
jgi:hypothetical protein